MAKSTSSFFCKSCGASSAKWVGKCPACGEWNTYVEEIVQKEKIAYKSAWKLENQKNLVPVQLKEINQTKIETKV